MRIFETNAGLGYGQLAYLVRMQKSENGHNYLCVGKNFQGESEFEVGEIVKDLESFYVQVSDWDIKNSDYSENFFFKFWVDSIEMIEQISETINDEKQEKNI